MKFLLFLLAIMSLSFSTPITLRDNTSRIFNSDDLFDVNFEKWNPFTEVNHFSFQAINRYYFTNDTLLSGNRLMLLGGDSLHYKSLDVIAYGFFDQKGIYGENIDWSKPDNAHDYSPRKSVDLYRALIRFTPADWVTISLGKDYYNWGPLELGGLLLSDYNSGFVSLYQEYHAGPFTIKGLATQLNSDPWGYGVATESIDLTSRFLSTSRVEFYRQRWGVAIEQAALYAGIGRSFEIPYLIPVFPFHYAQMSNWRYGNNGDNSYGGIDFYVNWLDKQLELYGELFIDDIQGDSDSISQGVQNNIAGMGGIRWNFTKGWYGFIEGGQVNSFVYNHISGEKLRYQSKNAFIGSPLGPDQRLLWGEFGYRIKPTLSIDLTGWYRQSGERDINYEYTTVHGTRDDPIPYGVVESEVSGWVTAKYRWRGISAEINGGATYYDNLGNMTGNSKVDPFLGLLLKSGLNMHWPKKSTDK